MSKAYAYNAGRRYTNVARYADGGIAKKTRDGKPLVFNKACRRFVRSVNRRLNSRIERKLMELWAKRAWEES